MTVHTNFMKGKVIQKLDKWTHIFNQAFCPRKLLLTKQVSGKKNDWEATSDLSTPLKKELPCSSLNEQIKQKQVCWKPSLLVDLKWGNGPQICSRHALWNEFQSKANEKQWAFLLNK